MDIREQLAEIRQRRGVLTAAVVLDEARDPAHPLHDRFEWDDSAAAERYRLEQARNIIRSARIVYRDPTETSPAGNIRAYHSVARPNGTRVYEPAEEIAANPEMTEFLKQQMHRDWMAMLHRYGTFEDFWKLTERKRQDRENVLKDE